MSTNGSRPGRIDRLERIWPTGECPVCRDRPRRLATVDAATGETLSETMPASGCPACGQLPLIDHEIMLASAGDDQKGGMLSDA